MKCKTKNFETQKNSPDQYRCLPKRSELAFLGYFAIHRGEKTGKQDKEKFGHKLISRPRGDHGTTDFFLYHACGGTLRLHLWRPEKKAGRTRLVRQAIDLVGTEDHELSVQNVAKAWLECLSEEPAQGWVEIARWPGGVRPDNKTLAPWHKKAAASRKNPSKRELILHTWFEIETCNRATKIPCRVEINSGRPKAGDLERRNMVVHWKSAAGGNYADHLQSGPYMCFGATEVRLRNLNPGCARAIGEIAQFPLMPYSGVVPE